MKAKPKPITIPADVAARCDGPDQAQRMDALVRAVFSVPRSEILKREADWKKSRAKAKRKQSGRGSGSA